MDSNYMNRDKNENSLSFIIQLFCSSIGLIFYFILLIIFNFLYKKPSMIKKEIFTFIFLYSIKPILVTIISSPLKNQIISYIIGIISFYLIISYIDKCLTSKRISKNPENYQLSYKYYLFLIFIVCTFPLIQYFNLPEKYLIADYLIYIIIAVIIYEYIKSKFKLLLDYLNEKKETTTKIPDIYLPYMKAYSFYTSFNSANLIFKYSCILIIIYFWMNILYILIKKNILCFIALILEKISGFCLIVGCLILFHPLNTKIMKKGKKDENDEEEAINISSFNVIDVDIQQDEKEEASSISVRKKRDKKKEAKPSNNIDNNYTKIKGEESKENEKDKDKDNENPTKLDEEESLKN